jgi:hypothetical protein
MPDAIPNPRDLPPPKSLRRRPSPPRDIKTVAERLAIQREQAPSFATKVSRVLIGIAAAIAVLLVIFLILSAFDSDNNKRAPWSSPSAPNVVPLPISRQ